MKAIYLSKSVEEGLRFFKWKILGRNRGRRIEEYRKFRNFKIRNVVEENIVKFIKTRRIWFMVTSTEETKQIILLLYKSKLILWFFIQTGIWVLTLLTQPISIIVGLGWWLLNKRLKNQKHNKYSRNDKSTRYSFVSTTKRSV